MKKITLTLFFGSPFQKKLFDSMLMQMLSTFNIFMEAKHKKNKVLIEIEE